jgi:hypothetical protein
MLKLLSSFEGCGRDVLAVRDRMVSGPVDCSRSRAGTKNPPARAGHVGIRQALREGTRTDRDRMLCRFRIALLERVEYALTNFLDRA